MGLRGTDDDDIKVLGFRCHGGEQDTTTLPNKNRHETAEHAATAR